MWSFASQGFNKTPGTILTFDVRLNRWRVWTVMKVNQGLMKQHDRWLNGLKEHHERKV